MTTFNAGRSAWKLNQTHVISQGKIPILQYKGRGWPGYRSCRRWGQGRVVQRRQEGQLELQVSHSSLSVSAGSSGWVCTPLQ